MGDNSVINFKAYLMNPDLLEVRRFTVDTNAVTNYMFMREKLQAVFPILKNASFKMTWRDADSDSITISSDEELITALTEMSDSLKLIYIQMEVNDGVPNFFLIDGPEVQHEHGRNHYPVSNVICDVCEKHITGYRYKCMQCPDYDLCSECEHKGNHSEHLMVRVPQSNIALPKSTRRYVNHINRSLRKAAHATPTSSTAGHCRRSFGGPGRCPFVAPQGCSLNRSNSTSNAVQQGTAKEPTGAATSVSRPTNCPFQSTQSSNNDNPGEELNINNFVDLAANLARQHLNPFVEALHSVTAQNPETPPVTIADLLGAFMGQLPQQTLAATAPTPAKNNTSSNNDTQAVSTAASAPVNSQQEQQEQLLEKHVQSVPMDVTTTPPERHVTFQVDQVQQPQASTSTELGKPAEPGWTLVSSADTFSSGSTTSDNGSMPSVVEAQIPDQEPAQPTAPLHKDPVIAAGLARLQEMGFSDTSEWLVHLLEQHNGNVGKTVEAIINNRFR